MSKISKIIEKGKEKYEKELDIIKLLTTIRHLKEYVKNVKSGKDWSKIKAKTRYLSKYIIDIDTEKQI